MFCSQCGKENADSAKFCRYCGVGFATNDSEKSNSNFEMKKKKPVFLWIGIAAIVIISIVAIVVVVTSKASSKDIYEEKIDLGRKYLLEMDYEQAILAFEDAINIDPKRTDAYLELAALYDKDGKTEEAIRILDKAEKNIDNDKDKEKILEIRKKIKDDSGNIISSDKNESKDLKSNSEDSIDIKSQDNLDGTDEQYDEDGSDILQNTENVNESDSGKITTILDNMGFKEKKVSYKVEAKKVGDNNLIGVSRADGLYYTIEGDSPQINEINRQLKEDAERAIYRIPDDFNIGGYSLSYKLYDWPDDMDPYSVVDFIYYYVYNIKQVDRYIALDIAEGCYVGEKDYSLMFSLDTGEQIVNITEVSQADSVDEVYEQVIDVLKSKGYTDADVSTVIWSLEDYIQNDEGKNTWWSMTETNDIMIRIGYYSELMTDVVIPSKFNSKKSLDEDKDIIEQIIQAHNGDIVTFGRYEQDNDFSNGKEPIEWIVLSKDDEQVLLLSKYVLDWVSFHNKYDYGIKWENCTLRSWLNNSFYDNAFDKKEKEKIINTKIVNSDNLTYGIDGGKDTNDKVFLLSLDDIKNPKYGFSKDYNENDISRRCSPTEYAKARGVWTLDKNTWDENWLLSATDDGEATCWWWLRSPGNYEGRAAIVNYGGNVYDFGTEFGLGLDDISNGVRPAIYINISPNLSSNSELPATIESTSKTNEEVDKVFMKQLKKICKKHAEEEGLSSIDFDYVLKDIDGDDIHEAIFVRYRSGMYLYSYEDGTIKDLFPNWGHIIDKLIFYPKTKSMIHIHSNHGGERYDYYQMKNGKYVIVSSKVRRVDEDGLWSFYNETDQEITESDFEDSISKLVKGKKIVVSQNEFTTYYYNVD